MVEKTSNAEAIFKLYVVGHHMKTRRTIRSTEENLDRVLGPDRYELKVIDISTDRQSAFDGKILATPTLVRCRPLPEVRVIGHVDNDEGIATLVRDVGLRIAGSDE